MAQHSMAGHIELSLIPPFTKPEPRSEIVGASLLEVLRPQDGRRIHCVVQPLGRENKVFTVFGIAVADTKDPVTHYFL